MNIYRFQFYARCPNDNEIILYRGEIRTIKTIMVEDLRAFFPEYGYQEEIADKFHSQFGGHQVLCATHQGVEIKTVRA